MNNEEKNSYVKQQITQTTIDLLKEHPFSDLSIIEITTAAKVSRNSFYRNYADKEDILFQHVKKLYADWADGFQRIEGGSNDELYASLFAHLKDNADFYLLLKKHGLFHLFLRVLTEHDGAKPEDENIWAYIKSFITYGTYGWIEEWMKRGMQESAEAMAALLSTQGMEYKKRP